MNNRDVPTSPGDPEQPEPVRYRPSAPQWTLVAIIIAFGVGLALYHILKNNGLGQSAALYIGIPIVLAVVLTLTAPSHNPVGTTMKVTTILLLLSIPVLGEGACCVLIAAPIFYLFAYLGAAAVVAWRKKHPPSGLTAVAIPALLVLLALEGTVPALTPRADAASTATRVIDLPVTKVADALALPMRFEGVRRSGILAIGFPTPRHDSGGLKVGATRTITFDGAHHRNVPVAQHHWGAADSALTLRVASRADHSVTFTRVADTSPLATWLRWDRIDVSWKRVDDRRSEVRWQVHYTRLLSPSWYFGPIERLVTWRAADYLIRTIDVDGVSATSAHHTHSQ